MAKQPEKLGKYDIVGKLGKGAMGEVYKGHDPVLNRHVAIKVIAESLDMDSDLVERFRREAKMAAQLNHPNIITIYDFVEEEGNIYIVMELLDGQDLKDLIKSGSPLTVDQILGIMEQISDGLGFAHDAGMVHRDLKPANIHITKKGQIKILDFGLVHEESSDMTKTGHIMGTPNYMSPEQVQGMKVDPRSDIFSLGAVFYELLTRKKPFSADSIHATMFKVVQGEREPLSQYTHLPAPLVAMVDRALDANPDGRYNDGNALREHLRDVRKETANDAGADATMTGVGQDATILTPGVEPGSHPSAPGTSSHPSRSGRSVPNRSGMGASTSGSRGGTMRRREMTSHSVGATSPSRPMGLYIGGAVVVAVIAGALFYLSGGRQPAGPSVEELAQQLSASQQELMLQSLGARDYTDALSQAETLLASDPQNTEALRVRSEATAALDEIDAAVTEARAALARGDTEEAAESLARVLALDPAHPLGAELHDQLNQHFQSQAEGARAAMEATRNQASSAGAASRAEFLQADQRRKDADADFNRGEYTNSAQKYLAARDQFQQAQTAHRQAEAASRQNTERAAASEAAGRQALQTAMAKWNRLRNQPADAGLTDQPSYQRALSEEAAAKQLEGSGDLGGAARSYDTASSYLEAARREYAEAQSRQVAAAPPTPPPSPPSSNAPPTSTAPATSSAPTRDQEEAAIRQTLATYERAIESKNLDLFRQAKPNLSRDEAKRLTDSFEAVDSHDVELDIRTVTIQGESATAVVNRSDTIVVRGRSQNGNSRQQTFVLQKAGGSWIVTEIQ